jgi:hypothetical protein
MHIWGTTRWSSALTHITQRSTRPKTASRFSSGELGVSRFFLTALICVRFGFHTRALFAGPLFFSRLGRGAERDKICVGASRVRVVHVSSGTVPGARLRTKNKNEMWPCHHRHAGFEFRTHITLAFKPQRLAGLSWRRYAGDVKTSTPRASGAILRRV